MIVGFILEVLRMRRYRLFFPSIAAGIFLSMAVLGGIAVPSRAQSVDASMLRTMHWRSIGPFRGGRTRAVCSAERAERVLHRRGEWRRLAHGRLRENVGADLRQ